MADLTHNVLFTGDQSQQLGYVHDLFVVGSATAIGTTTLAGLAGIDLYKLEVKTSTSGGETVSIKGLLADATTTLTSALTVTDASTGRDTTSTNLATGTYWIPIQWPFNKYVFTKSAGVQVGAVSVTGIYYPGT